MHDTLAVAYTFCVLLEQQQHERHNYMESVSGDESSMYNM